MKGPYMNDDGDWWVAVEDAPSFVSARGHVVGCLSYSIPEDGTLRYLGKVRTVLCEAAYDSEHEVGASCDNECRRDVLAYHFEENRRW
jgi:hypothetical protein